MQQLLEHPVEADPDAVRAAAGGGPGRPRRRARSTSCASACAGRSQSISRDFDRVLRILDSWGYVDGWSLTDVGHILARTFHECDLLIVECLRQGIFDGLEPAALAGLVSVFVYEHRSPEPPPAPWFPSPAAKRRWQRIAAVSAELQAIEDEAGLGMHRAPDPTFIAVAYAWAAGEGFAEVVEAEELSGGDFVRTMKQLIDLLRQLALVAPVARHPPLRRAGGRAPVPRRGRRVEHGRDRPDESDPPVEVEAQAVPEVQDDDPKG